MREQVTSRESRLRTLEETSRVDNSHHEHESDYVSGHDPASAAALHAAQMRSYNQQIPLLENLQRELGSAQDTINALTNQNSQLRADLMSSHQSIGSDDTAGQVDQLSTSIRQLESERNQVLDQLREEQHERQSVQAKLQNMQHELATQAPATLNGDLINKTQFEALQHAMQQLEEKYTGAMRSKAELTDEAEQLEHIIMQLQGETETIGEYVQLYQMQRQVLRRKHAEKDEYISRLSREREQMQDKVAQLQALVMQLLADKNMLHAYQKHGSALTNHVTPFNGLAASTPKRPAQSDSNQDDWPDYSSDDDSDTSEVEQIVAGASLSLDSSPLSEQHVTSHADNSARSSSAQLSPAAATHGDFTAQRIMHLLTELGSSNVMELNTYSELSFVHCANCSGRLLNL